MFCAELCFVQIIANSDIKLMEKSFFIKKRDKINTQNKDFIISPMFTNNKVTEKYIFCVILWGFLMIT